MPLASALATDRSQNPIVAPYKEYEYLSSSFPPIMPEIKVHPPLNIDQLNQHIDKLLVEDKSQPNEKVKPPQEVAPQELAYPSLVEELKHEVDVQQAYDV